jgi:hypothetical protein
MPLNVVDTGAAVTRSAVKAAANMVMLVLFGLCDSLGL